MKRIQQTFEEIESSLVPIEASWFDSHAEEVINLLREIPAKGAFTEDDAANLLDQHFDGATTVIRLFLDLSKDEFTHQMRQKLGPGGIGVTRYRTDRSRYLGVLSSSGINSAMTTVINRPLHWSDVLIERLKGGRGSAIKGQTRGRVMEDFVESIVRTVFDPSKVVVRCRFTGSRGTSTEKADFAIPSNTNPAILIEVKACGATGSKQTDVLGDIARIVEEKRHYC